MEKVAEDEEKTIEEANNSVERFVDQVDDTQEGSTDPSNSHTVTFEDHEMEHEEVLQLFRRNSGVRPEVSSSNNFPYLNKSKEMVLRFEEDTPAETNLNSPQILEGIIRSSSSSNEDADDSSSNSDLDSSLSRYYFDGSLPETHEDESIAPKDENQKMSLLCPKQPTSWRNFCGLFELLRAADP